jgi:DNA-binding PadR family transcriptional regulator
MHGYDLHKTIKQQEGLSLLCRFNQSNLYAILEKLENDGLLSSRHIVEESSHPRKEFQITTAGLERFHQWIVEPVQNSFERRKLFMAKLYFALKVDTQIARKLINDQYASAIVWRNEINDRINHLNPEKKFERTVYNARLFQVEAWLKCLDDCKTEFLSPRIE